MFRPVTSSVSAVSRVVAKGHQAVHHVSCSPSKIPYVGFSPVRLETGIQLRPSQIGRRVKREARIRRPTMCLYAARALLSTSVAHSGNLARRLSKTIQSRGPWLVSGLCCPAESSLTMASSEALDSSRWLIFFVRRIFALRPHLGWSRETPRFTPYVFSSVPSPGPRRLKWLLLSISSPLAEAFATLVKARQTQFPRTSVPAWVGVTRLY